jgi:chromosomal replication initiation ATPase DnaA
MNLNLHKESPWASWITRADPDAFKDLSDYDKICEMVVHSYNLTHKNRKMDLIDQRQFFIFWWKENERRMKKYNTYTAIARLLKQDHATILHLLRKRKKSLDYDDNVACIKDFLES